MKTVMSKLGLLSSARAALLVIALGMTTLLCTPAAQAATLVSDKDDYAPGETAYLLGTGFQAGEAVAITLAVHTQDGTILDYAVGGIYADGEGSIAASWLVPQEALNTWIEATAIGDQSALVAVAIFTDSVTSVSLNSPTTASPVTVTTDGATITVNISYSTTLPPPGGNPNVHFEIIGITTVQYNTEPAGNQANRDYDITIPAGTPNGSYDLKVTVIHQGNTSVTQTDAITVDVPTVEPPDCPENHAPTITASEYILSSVCATWNGSALTVTVPVSPSDFSPVTGDPDGDPVSVSLNVTEVTLTGLGEVCATVTLTATDDPSLRNVDGCDELEPKSTDTTAKVKANLTFNFDGFASPLDNYTARKVKNGSTVPVKFRLTDCNGTEICSTPTPNWIWVGCQSEFAPLGGVEVDDSGASNDNGVNFRYSGACGDGTWIYNLSTKTGYSVGKTYKITAVLADGSTHDVLICINK